jgi:hypothetical protein
VTIHIDVIDQSGSSGRYDWPKIVHACEMQVRLHVAQAWGMGNSAMIEMRSAPVSGHWPVYLLKNADEVPDALGWHETDASYRPVGYVGVETDEKYGLSPSVTLSHEVCEIIGDPWADASIQVSSSEFWARELCDPVEADRDGYEYDGVLLSDFVFPSWFSLQGQAPYTYARRVTRPRVLRPGGYQAKWSQSTGWLTQATPPAPGAQVSRSKTMARNFTRSLDSYMSTLLPVED